MRDQILGARRALVVDASGPGLPGDSEKDSSLLHSTGTSQPSSWCAPSCFPGGNGRGLVAMDAPAGDINPSLCFAGFPSYPDGVIA